jgi:hypothetical protein
MSKLCLKYRKELAEKQYELSKININGIRSLTDIKILNNHIKDLLYILKTLRCEGTNYLGQEPKIIGKKSTKLKLNRELDPKKLFIRVAEIKRMQDKLPPKKRKTYGKLQNKMSLKFILN